MCRLQVLFIDFEVRVLVWYLPFLCTVLVLLLYFDVKLLHRLQSPRLRIQPVLYSYYNSALRWRTKEIVIVENVDNIEFSPPPLPPIVIGTPPAQREQKSRPVHVDDDVLQGGRIRVERSVDHG